MKRIDVKNEQTNNRKIKTNKHVRRSRNLFKFTRAN